MITSHAGWLPRNRNQLRARVWDYLTVYAYRMRIMRHRGLTVLYLTKTKTEINCIGLSAIQCYSHVRKCQYTGFAFVFVNYSIRQWGMSVSSVNVSYCFSRHDRRFRRRRCCSCLGHFLLSIHINWTHYTDSVLVKWRIASLNSSRCRPNNEQHKCESHENKLLSALCGYQSVTLSY